jgi:hypothetical protein
MAKTKISEFDSTPANNTDIDSINIAEGCAPSGINNAIRELMSQLKDQQTGASADNFTVGGNLVVTGTSVHTGATTFTGAVVMSSALPIASGGTAATTAAGARTSLGAAASGANSDITSITGLTTALTVAQGGTGAVTHTSKGVMIGNGTSAVTTVSPGTTGNILKSDGTSWISTTSPTQVLSSSFTSTNQAGPTATATAYTIAHTLGVVPKIVRLVAVCTTASVGYAVGDEIELLFSNGTNGNFQAFYYSNATVVGYWSGPYIIINNASNGTQVDLINNSNFAFKVYAFA